MKKMLSVLLILCILFTVSSCDGGSGKVIGQTKTSVDTVEALSEQISVKIALPEQARNAQFYNIDGLIAEITFTYEGFFFTFRASKLYAGSQLAGIEGDIKKESTITIDDDTEGFIGDTDDGGRVVSWIKDGTNKTLVCQKYIAESYFIDLCSKL